MPDFSAFLGQGTHALMLPAWLELTAVVVGSLSGSLVAIDRKLDMTGCVALSLICGLGGGLIRDIIMQKGDVYMLNSTPAILLCVLAGIVVFHFPKAFFRIPNAIEWADIVEVGLFCAAGVSKALGYGLGGVQAVLMGVITGVGGGLLRDVCLGDVPRIFQTSNLYALCALGGSLTYFALHDLAHVMNPWLAIACTLVTVALRRASLRWGHSLFHEPGPHGHGARPRTARRRARPGSCQEARRINKKGGTRRQPAIPPLVSLEKKLTC